MSLSSCRTIRLQRAGLPATITRDAFCVQSFSCLSNVKQQFDGRQPQHCNGWIIIINSVRVNNVFRLSTCWPLALGFAMAALNQASPRSNKRHRKFVFPLSLSSLLRRVKEANTTNDEIMTIIMAPDSQRDDGLQYLARNFQQPLDVNIQFLER